MLGSSEISEPYDEAESVDARFKSVTDSAGADCSAEAVVSDTGGL